MHISCVCVCVCVCDFHSSALVTNAAGMHVGVQIPPGMFVKSLPWDVSEPSGLRASSAQQSRRLQGLGERFATWVGLIRLLRANHSTRRIT